MASQLPRPEGRGPDKSGLRNLSPVQRDLRLSRFIGTRRYLGAIKVLRDSAVSRLWLVTLHTRHRTVAATV